MAWPELLAHPDVTTTTLLASELGVLAYHGGVEPGTLEVATTVARRTGASLYAVRQPELLRWHVASTAVDPAHCPNLTAFLGRVRVVLSIHGYRRRSAPWEILLGGRNRDLAGAVAAALRAHCDDVVVVDTVEDIPPALRGLHPANPVNLPADAGVQIELPFRLRRSPEHLARVADALAGTLAGLQ